MIEAWKIGVSIAMSSNASAVLGVLGRDLFGMGKHAEALTGQLNAAKVAAIGALGVIGGGAIVAGMVKLVEHGKELVHQQALFQAALQNSGMTAQQIAAETATATAAAWKTAHDVLGTTVAENMKTLREGRMVFGDENEAIANLPAIAKAQVILNSVRESGGSSQTFEMMKALEIKGVSMDPEHFNKLLNDMVAAAIASGGRVLGNDFLNTFKYGRTATQGWNDQFVATILPTLIQEMKGSGNNAAGGPGNALQSAFQAVVGGTMSNKAVTEFLRLGLVDPTKIIRTTTGHVKGIEPGGVRGSGEFESNPYAWAQDVLVPALKKAGISSPDAIREEIAHLFVNRTAQQIMTMFVTQQARFEKDAKLIGDAGGLNAFDQLQATDPTTKMLAFTSAWNNLLTALGAPLVEPAYQLLSKFTGVLTDISQWAAANPGLVRVIGEVAAAIGVGVAVGGAVTLVGAIAALAGPAAGIAVAAAGVAALASAIALLTPEVKGWAAGFDLTHGWAEKLDEWGYEHGIIGTKPPHYDENHPAMPPGPPPPVAPRPGFPTPLHYGSPLSGWPAKPASGPAQTGPVPVIVTNPRDLSDGLTRGLASRLSRDPAAPQGFDGSAGPQWVPGP